MFNTIQSVIVAPLLSSGHCAVTDVCPLGRKHYRHDTPSCNVPLSDSAKCSFSPLWHWGCGTSAATARQWIRFLSTPPWSRQHASPNFIPCVLMCVLEKMCFCYFFCLFYSCTPLAHIFTANRLRVILSLWFLFRRYRRLRHSLFLPSNSYQGAIFCSRSIRLGESYIVLLH